MPPCGARATSASQADVGGNPRVWIVMIAERPVKRNALRDLLLMLREHGARRVSQDLFVVPDQLKLGPCLNAFADRIAGEGGRVMLAESTIVDDGDWSGPHAE